MLEHVCQASAQPLQTVTNRRVLHLGLALGVLARRELAFETTHSLEVLLLQLLQRLLTLRPKVVHVFTRFSFGALARCVPWSC